MSNITITIDRDELLERVANLGVTYSALAGTGISVEEVAELTDSIDEAFVDALLEDGDEPWAEGYIVVGPDTIPFGARRILFASQSQAEAHLDETTTKNSRHKYEIIPLTRA